MSDHYALLSLITLIFMFTCVFLWCYFIERENRQLRKALKQAELEAVDYMQEIDLLHAENRKLRFQLFFLTNKAVGKTPVKTSIIPFKK